MRKIPTFKREAAALVVLTLTLLFLSRKLSTQDFSNTHFFSNSRSQGECNWLYFKLLFEKQGVLDVRSHDQETNSVLKPFYTEILLENGGKRTSEHLDMHLNIIVWVAGLDLAYLFAMTPT